MHSRAATALASALVVLAAGAAIWWVPWLTHDRDFAASIPQPPPLFTLPLIKLNPGARACFPDAVMDTHSQTARFRVNTHGRRPEPLLLRLSAHGYRVTRPVPAAYTDNATIDVPVPAPSRDVTVTVCLRNDGRRAVSLFGSDDQTEAPYRTRVDGRLVKPNPQFAFYERRPASIADRLGTMVERAGTFRSGIVGPWTLWPLIALVAVGVPAAVLWALWAGWRDQAESLEDAG